MRIPASPVLALALALAGCGPFVHRIDIQQGNAVAPESFAKLKPGMTRAEEMLGPTSHEMDFERARIALLKTLQELQAESRRGV